MAKPTDPLLAALIDRLPGADTEWPVDRQIAWLHLTAIAFGTIYGGNAAAELFGGKTVAISAPKPPQRKFHALIDRNGIARHGTEDGPRIMPSDVNGELADLRGDDGDMSAVTWADGSKGVLAIDAVIVPVT